MAEKTQSDIEAAFKKWGGVERPNFESDTYRMIQLAFAEGWRARGRHDVDVVGLLHKEHTRLVLSAEDITRKARNEGRRKTPHELFEVIGYVQRIKSINRWFEVQKGTVGR